MRRFSRVRCEGGLRVPIRVALDECVVAAAAANPFWSIKLVIALDADSGDLFDEIHEPVNGHHLGAPNVDGIDNLAIHECACSVKAVIDKHKAARLLAIAPNLNFMAS